MIACVHCGARDGEVAPLEACPRRRGQFAPGLEGRPAPHELVDLPVGPVACGTCGWDDVGELRLLDVWEHFAPPIPRSAYAPFGCWGDEGKPRGLCGGCGDDLEPGSVVARPPDRLKVARRTTGPGGTYESRTLTVPARVDVPDRARFVLVQLRDGSLLYRRVADEPEEQEVSDAGARPA